MKRLRHRKGLTLVELLIALAITAVVLTGFLSTLRGGIAAYRRIDSSANEIHELRLFMTLLESELRNSFFYAEAPFLGGAQEFSFPTVANDYEKDVVQKKPVWVRYEMRAKTLYRKESLLRNLFTEKKDSSKKIISPLKTFVVQYAYRQADHPEIFWFSEWPSQLGLPKGVQITLTFEGDKARGGQRAKDMSVTRSFFNPQGNWGWIEKDLF